MSRNPLNRTVINCLVFLVLIFCFSQSFAADSQHQGRNETFVYRSECTDDSVVDSDQNDSELVELHLLGEHKLEPVAANERDTADDKMDGDLLDQRTLIKLHGAFMVFAWLGTTTIGVLIAR